VVDDIVDHEQHVAPAGVPIETVDRRHDAVEELADAPPPQPLSPEKNS
jgi:hypothetical protein